MASDSPRTPTGKPIQDEWTTPSAGKSPFQGSPSPHPSLNQQATISTTIPPPLKERSSEKPRGRSLSRGRQVAAIQKLQAVAGQEKKPHDKKKKKTLEARPRTTSPPGAETPVEVLNEPLPPAPSASPKQGEKLTSPRATLETDWWLGTRLINSGAPSLEFQTTIRDFLEKRSAALDPKEKNKDPRSPEVAQARERAISVQLPAGITQDPIPLQGLRRKRSEERDEEDHQKRQRAYPPPTTYWKPLSQRDPRIGRPSAPKPGDAPPRPVTYAAVTSVSPVAPGPSAPRYSTSRIPTFAAPPTAPKVGTVPTAPRCSAADLMTGSSTPTSTSALRTGTSDALCTTTARNGTARPPSAAQDSKHLPNTETSAEVRKPRYPPIVVEVLPNWAHHVKTLKERLGRAPNARAFGKGIRFSPSDEDEYRVLQSYFCELEKTEKLTWFSYLLPEERSLKVAIRGLPADTSPQEITENLKTLGFEPESIRKIQARKGRPGCIFFAQLTRTPNVTPGIYDVTELLCMPGVIIERWRGRKGPAQCHRCQAFRHSSHCCHRPQACVRCGGEHYAQDCPRPLEEPATCANCGGAHTANNPRCPIFKKELRNKKAGTIAKTTPRENTEYPPPAPSLIQRRWTKRPANL